jgi:rubrerythrin
MSLNTEISYWMRSFLGIGDEPRRKVLEILRQRYIDATEQAARFMRHAEKMHYPQFREKLQGIAVQETEHADWLAKKIVALGGKLPEVREGRSTEESSWKHLLKALDEESRSTGDLMEQIWSVQSDYPDIAALLERISEDEVKHRNEIREMLMRSDAFADSLA